MMASVMAAPQEGAVSSGPSSRSISPIPPQLVSKDTSNHIKS